MSTFEVSDVERGDLLKRIDAISSVRDLLGKKVEALACDTESLVSCDTKHAFVKAAHDAFYNHLPMVIRPDDIWFCIVQGFAAHVGENVETLRSRLVAHEGKRKLTVERADFFLGRNNPWPEAFAAFSTQVGTHIGALHDVVAARFTTTTPTDIAAYDICLMDTFQGYFDYEMMCGCGIPSITVLGTYEDWTSMIPRLRHLAEYGLENWRDALVPILDKIADSADGKIDKDFWKSFFRYESGSGPAELTGWILTLFPYLLSGDDACDLSANPYLDDWHDRFNFAQNRVGSLRGQRAQGPWVGAIPGGLVSAPVKFVDASTGIEHELRFVAGMFGVAQDVETRALSVAFGWAITYE
jgi:hypothetical protein